MPQRDMAPYRRLGSLLRAGVALTETDAINEGRSDLPRAFEIMSEKYIAKKYVTVGSVFQCVVRCPNCHKPMLQAANLWFCDSSKKCKLFNIPFKEVKSLTTIERVD